MPRDVNGNFTLDPSNPVSPGTVIETGWANPTLTDIAAALTDSLSRSGSGGMLVAFRFADGTVAAPGIAFTNEPSSGFYRAALNDVRLSIGSQDVLRFAPGGIVLPAGKTLTGGAINGTVIGGTTPAAGTFTGVVTPLVDTGAAVDLALKRGGATRLLLTNNGSTFTGDVIPDADNARNFGNIGATWATGRFGTSVVTPLLTNAGALGISTTAGDIILTAAATGVKPGVDNTHLLGTPSARWATAYVGTSVVTPTITGPTGHLGVTGDMNISGDHAISSGVRFTDTNATPFAAWAVGISNGNGANALNFYDSTNGAIRFSIIPNFGAQVTGNLTVTGAINGGPQFASAEQAVTVSATTQVAHGLGSTPRYVRAVLRCKTAELGWAVGDEIDMNVSGGPSSLQGMALFANATNIGVRCGSGGPLVINAGFGMNYVTPANWKYVFYATL